MADPTRSIPAERLPEIRRKIETLNRRKDTIGESNTKAALIDPLLDYIAAYQVAPISAITHYAEVERIEPYQDTGKYIVYFKGSAKKIGPIPLPEDDLSVVPQSLRYANFQKLSKATTLADVF